jgi:hypothetical protein
MAAQDVSPDVSADPSAGSAGSGLRVEYLVRTRSTWGTRLDADGQAEEWTDASGWQPLPPVAAEDVAAFADLVRGSGFFDLPDALGDPGAVDDGSELTWTVELDGRRHRVIAREAGSNRDPVLRGLNDELQRIVGAALARRADAADEAAAPGATD